MPQGVEEEGLATLKFDLSVLHPEVEFDGTPMRRGKFWVRDQDKGHDGVPLLVFIGAGSSWLESIGVEHARNHEVAELLARMAVRARMPAETIVSEGMGREHSGGGMRTGHRLVQHAKRYAFTYCPQKCNEHVYAEDSPRAGHRRDRRRPSEEAALVGIETSGLR